jgi:uncharacterized protein YoxC
VVDPLFWLGLSLLLVAVSLTAVLVVAIPAMQELGRAARSAEKLFDTLGRELPPTLEAIRLTGLEITELTDDMSEGVQNAGRIVKQVDEGVSSARQQARSLNSGTRSFWAGAKAAWKTWSKGGKSSPRRAIPERVEYRSPARYGGMPSEAEESEPVSAVPGSFPEPPLARPLQTEPQTPSGSLEAEQPVNRHGHPPNGSFYRETQTMPASSVSMQSEDQASHADNESAPSRD